MVTLVRELRRVIAPAAGPGMEEDEDDDEDKDEAGLAHGPFAAPE